MTTSHHDEPTPAELEDMSQPELARLAAELDDVEIVHNAPKWPVPGTRASLWSGIISPISSQATW